MILRSIFIALLTVVYVSQPGQADDEEWPESARTMRAETLRAAVVEWCDEHTGYFILNKGHPFCMLQDDVRSWLFVGEWRMVEQGYWWSRRDDDTEGPRIAVLWLAEPNGYPPIKPDDQGKETLPQAELLAIECAFAHVAVNNPARVPVVLVGPAADECRAHIERIQ